MYGVLCLDETRFNDGAITALSNSAIDHLASLLTLSNTLQYLPLLLFLLLLILVQRDDLYSSAFCFFASE